MSSSDSTLVTGSPFSARGPVKGTVLGERWEVRELEEADALFLTMRAVDQESDSIVLMRLCAPGLLGDKDARRMAERLKKLIGKGGPTLSPFRDVDREGATLFSVEPYPTGASLRSVLEARRQKGQTFSPAELLPVVARLEAALSGIPAPFFHGDVRPQRIFVAPDRVLLTGGFFLSVMPGDALVDVLERDIPLRRQLAPEVGDGVAGRPSDRWSVAALVWEALTGTAPQPGPRSAPAKLGALGPVLTRYLDADPAHRPSTLVPLLDALATAAGVPTPALVPEPFAIEDDESDSDSTELAHRPALGSETIELLDGPKTEPGVHDTQRLPALDKDGKRPAAPKATRDLEGIDPALLQAAEAGRKISDSGTFELDGQELERLDPKASSRGAQKGALRTPAKASAPADLDPRLVRAALGMSLEGTPVPSKAPEKAGPAPARDAGRTPRKSSSVTQELDTNDLVAVGGAKRAGAGKAARPAAAPAPTTAPARPGAPKPVTGTGAAAPVRAPARNSAPAPQPVARAAPEPARTSSPAPAPRAPVADAAAVPGPAPGSLASPFAAPAAGSYPAPAAPRRAPRSGPTGGVIVGAALVIALLILGAALWYRHTQDAEARENLIDARLRALNHD